MGVRFSGGTKGSMSDTRYYAECHCDGGSKDSPWGSYTIEAKDVAEYKPECYDVCTLYNAKWDTPQQTYYANTRIRELVDNKCQTCDAAGYTLTAAQAANRDGCSQCELDGSKYKCGNCNSGYQLCSSDNTCVACSANMWDASTCTCNTCEGLGYTLTAEQAANRSGCTTCPSDSTKYKCGGCNSRYNLCEVATNANYNKCILCNLGTLYNDRTCSCVGDVLGCFSLDECQEECPEGICKKNTQGCYVPTCTYNSQVECEKRSGLIYSSNTCEYDVKQCCWVLYKTSRL